MKKSGIKVLFVASECAPFAKCGGLGDVVSALPAALRKLGADARIILPLYDSILPEKWNLVREASFLVTCGSGEVIGCGLWRGTTDGETPVWFIEHNRFFARGGIYDFHGAEFGDNAFRFGLLCLAAAQFCRNQSWLPDVVHVHDWPTAIFPVLLDSWKKAGNPLGNAASVLTIHNQAYQGYYHPSVLPFLGVEPSYFTPDGLEAWGKVNLLKGGIQFADAITTVSPTYAKEICSEPGGNGLSDYLQNRKNDLSGILNGADYEVWNPATDPHIAANFRPQSMRGKAQCKQALQAYAGIPQSATIPLYGVVTRLAEQKGMGLLRAVLPQILATSEMQFILLGAGNPDDENFFRGLANEFPKQVGVEIGYSEERSHQIQAGSDFFLMPSLFEPCGLTQMYAMRYGTLPIAHSTGGLEDTIEPYNEGEARGTGFKFYAPTALAFQDAIESSLQTWTYRPAHIAAMRKQAMKMRFDWGTSARRYLEVYRQAMSKHEA